MKRIERFRVRRIRNLLTTIFAASAMLIVVRWQQNRLSNSAFSSGYVLSCILLFLMAFHWRKRIAFLPLGNASTWMQVHIYLALLSAPLFGTHIGWSLPSGWFEVLLASLFLLTFANGLWGLYLTRTYPRRLAQCSQQYLYERIPAARHQLQIATRSEVLLAVEQHGATTLADFYTRQLAAYLEQPRSFWFWLMPDTQMRRRMTRELAGLNRYLTDQEQEVAERLFRTIRVKDELDYQHALQWMLKMWLFVHLALSYALLLCVIGHIILVHAFHGGWR